MPTQDRIFDIQEYSPDKLASLLYKTQQQSWEVSSEQDGHFKYLRDFYFNQHEGLNPKFIVIEENYVEKDYLIDYVSYYAEFFNSPSPKCIRLHFFANNKDYPVTIDEFYRKFCDALLYEQPSKDFWEHDYLGFITVRPIPVFNIGFTLLKHYNSSIKLKAQERKFWGIGDYKVHLFGKEVFIPSVAFHEQDANLAACATISIWTVLQAAHKNYGIATKSPGEITHDADVIAFNGNRLVPNEGLVIPQICKSLVTEGLVTEVREVFIKTEEGYVFDWLYFKKLVNAYSTLKIPIILAMNVPDDGYEGNGHAVAIVGQNELTFSEEEWSKQQMESEPITWIANQINKIYVHDDAWGCFARMSFLENKGHGLSSLWGHYGNDQDKDKPSRPDSLIIPVLPQVRISYEIIEEVVTFFDEIFDLLELKESSFRWNIQLFSNEDYKADFNMISTKLSPNDERLKDFQNFQLSFLKSSLPSYIWVATCFMNNQEGLVLIFDATGMRYSMLGIKILCFEDVFKEDLQLSLTDQNYEIIKSSMIEYDMYREDYLLFLKNNI
jgi:hypothetical protein